MYCITRLHLLVYSVFMLVFFFQVLRMEHLILKVLKFDVSSPTANWFADHFLQESDSSDQVKSLAMVRNFVIKV